MFYFKTTKPFLLINFSKKDESKVFIICWWDEIFILLEKSSLLFKLKD